MTLNKKIKYFIIFIVIANIAGLSGILFLLNSMEKDADLLMSRKKDLIQIKKRAENSEKMEKICADYNLELEKIDNLFAKKSSPIEFIEFFENTAESCSLLTEISYLSFQKFQKPKKGESTNLYPWDFFNIKINARGDFNDIFHFIAKIENSPYLIEIENFNISKQEEKNKDIKEDIIEYISADLSLKIYAK